MAKKSNTLNELTKFLASEQNSHLVETTVDAPTFLNKEPLMLIDTPISNTVDSNKTNKEIQKFIDSNALRKTSFDEVNEMIKTLALDNKMSVQQVLSILYYKSILPYSITNWMEWSTNIQKSYSLFMSDFQKKWWNK